MAENHLQSPGPGGFMPSQTLPSPAPSSASAATNRSVAGLPHPRAHALRPGSAKEDQVRRFVSDRMLNVSRRYVKRFGKPEQGDQVVGYKSMGELCRDVDSLVDVIWLSGTPSLQVPLLLNIAQELAGYLPAFPASPVAMFGVLTKLDHCFASLLAGADADTREPLPGFENGLRAGMSRTDMVRCKSIVEQTRVLVVDAMSKEPEAEEEEEADGNETQTGEDTEMETDKEDGGGGRVGIWDEDEERLNMDVARVYEKTLIKLGETLGDDGLGNGA